LHRFDDGEAECGSGLWLDERLDFARCFGQFARRR
jgi:hypothetical protein